MMWNLTDSRFERDLEQGKVWGENYLNMVIPLLDIMNHHSPKSLDDDYSFTISVFPPHTQYPQSNAIAVSVDHPILLPGDEVTYVYNQHMESFK